MTIAEQLQPILTKHEALGWNHFQIARIDSGKRVSLRATYPSGKKVFQAFEEADLPESRLGSRRRPWVRVQVVRTQAGRRGRL